MLLDLTVAALAIAPQIAPQIAPVETLHATSLHATSPQVTSLQATSPQVTSLQATSPQEYLTQTGIAHLNQGELRQARQTLEQAATIARQKNDRLGTAAALTPLGQAHLYLGQYPEAIAVLQEALQWHRATNNESGAGKSLSHLGEVYSYQGRSLNALQVLQEALELQQIDADRAETWRRIGEVETTLSEYSKAMESLARSLQLAKTAGDRREEGRSLHAMAVVHYSLGEYERALALAEAALEIAEETGDRVRQGPILDALGLVYHDRGEYSQALELFEKALTIRQGIGARAGEGNSLRNLGALHEALGQYARAAEYHRAALQIARELGFRELEASVLNSLGGIAYNLGQSAQSLEQYDRALAIAQEIGNQALAGNILHNIGASHGQLQQYDRALTYYHRALALRKSVGDRPGIAQTLHNAGSVYLRLQNPDRALEAYQQALALRTDLGDRRGLAATLNNIGQVYHSLKAYPEALEHYQKAARALRAIGDVAGEGIALSNMGNILFLQGKLAKAERTLFRAIARLESLREGLSDGDKVSIFETQTDTYTLLQEVLVARDRPEAALEVAERGRARAFVELLSQQVSDAAAAEFAPARHPSIADIRAIARAQNATLVEYANIWNRELFVWVVKPTGETHFRRVRLSERLSNRSLMDTVAAVRCFDNLLCERRLENSDRLNDANKADKIGQGFNQDAQDRQLLTPAPSPERPRSLQQLHHLLIDPIADLLPTDPTERVIFIPQGALFLVPFAALQNDSGTYLIEKHTILTAPAIQVLELTRQQRQQNARFQGEALVVGNPTMPNITTASGQLRSLQPLPGAESEALAIAQMLDIQPAIGDTATETAIARRMPRSRIIHLATHGNYDEEKGFNSWVALAPTPNADGFLTAAEILGLNLRAELVVLSACNTGRGRITGDGVISLSRSFLAAGASSAIVSLWAVPDTPTASLMINFYRNLARNPDKAQALRQAMLTTMTEFPDPKHWAAFALIGEAE